MPNSPALKSSSTRQSKPRYALIRLGKGQTSGTQIQTYTNAKSAQKSLFALFKTYAAHSENKAVRTGFTSFVTHYPTVTFTIETLP